MRDVPAPVNTLSREAAFANAAMDRGSGYAEHVGRFDRREKTIFHNAIMAAARAIHADGRIVEDGSLSVRYVTSVRYVAYVPCEPWGGQRIFNWTAADVRTIRTVCAVLTYSV